MAKYDDRINGVKDVSFEEAIANVKDDLRKQLVRIYFKEEPEFVTIIKDDEAYDKIYEGILDSDGIEEAYAVHSRRRCVIRFCGVLYKFSESFPPRIGNRVAMELGVRHTALYLKRSDDFTLTKLQRLKFYNKALKMEMMMLKEDLEWNDDLNDDMFNEIQRFERNVERERAENEQLLLKGKARKGEIELLHYKLLNEFGVEPPKIEKAGKTKGKKSSKCKEKDVKRKGKVDEDDDISEKLSSLKTSGERGFTSIVKD